jgi:hypothetical protein
MSHNHGDSGEAQVRTAATTLHALLDYDEEDGEDDATFELCVAAEAVAEVLAADYGAAVLAALCGGRCECGGGGSLGLALKNACRSLSASRTLTGA